MADEEKTLLKTYLEDRVAKSTNKSIYTGTVSKIETILSASDKNFELNAIGKLLDADEQKEVLDVIEENANNLPFILTPDLFDTLFDASTEQDLRDLLKNYVGVEGEDLLHLKTVFEKVANKIKKLSLTIVGSPYIDQTVIGNTIIDNSEPEEKVKNYVEYNESASIKPAGIADLLVVKKELTEFKEGEIVHIENVLASELRERHHKVLTRQTETRHTETSLSQENLKDIQSSEQFSLERETSTIINKQKYTDIGVNVSAKYGTKAYSVSLDAGYKAGTSAQTSKANRRASSFAKEITERALERILTKVTESRTVISMYEVEEFNKHVFNNVGSGNNITGIYRWVDKSYKIKTFNYGKRLMYQFMLDRPAANYIKSIKKDGTSNLKKPKHPSEIYNVQQYDFEIETEDGSIATGTDYSGSLQTFEDISKNNYQFWSALFGVKDIEPYPQEKVIYKAVKFENTLNPENSKLIGYSAVGEIKIPKDYEPNYALLVLSANDDEESPINVLLGERNYESLEQTTTTTTTRRRKIYLFWSEVTSVNVTETTYSNEATTDLFKGKENKEVENIPYSISYKTASDIPPVVNFKVVCEPTENAIKRWKIKIYNSIMEIYETRKRDYDQKLRALMTNSQIKGNNPGENRRIEKEEIRRACIESIANKTIKDFSFGKKNDDGKYIIQSTDNIDYHNMIAFMEEAFEWDEIIYEFLPYYWNQSRIDAEKHKDNDPLFQNFLRASVAKAVLPVRPGFEFPVMHFMNTHKLWDGTEEINGEETEENFKISSEDASLIPEINAMNNQQNVDNCDPVGEGDENSWILKVPTSLVVLSNADSLAELTI